MNPQIKYARPSTWDHASCLEGIANVLDLDAEEAGFPEGRLHREEMASDLRSAAAEITRLLKRVDDLIAGNNAEVERRRGAETRIEELRQKVERLTRALDTMHKRENSPEIEEG